MVSKTAVFVVFLIVPTLLSSSVNPQGTFPIAGGSAFNLNAGEELRYSMTSNAKALYVNASKETSIPPFCRLYQPTAHLSAPVSYRISSEDTIIDFLIVKDNIYVLTNSLMLMKLEIVRVDEFGKISHYVLIRERSFALQEMFPRINETKCQFMKYKINNDAVFFYCEDKIMYVRPEALDKINTLPYNFGRIRKVIMDLITVVVVKQNGDVDLWDFSNVFKPQLIVTLDPTYLGVSFLNIVDAHYMLKNLILREGLVILLDEINGLITVRVRGDKAELVEGSRIPTLHGLTMQVVGNTLLVITYQERATKSLYHLKEYFLNPATGTKGAELNQFFVSEQELVGIHMREDFNDAIILTPRAQYLYRHSIPKKFLNNPFNETAIQMNKNIFKMLTTDVAEGEASSNITVGASSTSLYVYELTNTPPLLVCKPEITDRAQFYQFSLNLYGEACKDDDECMETKFVSINLHVPLFAGWLNDSTGYLSTVIIIAVFAIIVLFVVMCLLILKYRHEIQTQVELLSKPKNERYREVDDKGDMDKTVGVLAQPTQPSFEIDESGAHHHPDVRDIIKESK